MTGMSSSQHILVVGKDTDQNRFPEKILRRCLSNRRGLFGCLDPIDRDSPLVSKSTPSDLVPQAEAVVDYICVPSRVLPV